MARNSAREVTSKLLGPLYPILSDDWSSNKCQGFTQTQQDEDDWNAQGKKSRKKREEKERVERVLSGHDATELYLQCYQLILWKQCHWLVNAKQFPPELETVVRDLWSLRIRELQPSLDDRSGYSSGTMGFSSTSEGELTDTDGASNKSIASSRRKRVVQARKKLPRLIETLALCYLGILLMRLPTSLGEIYKWARKEEIVFSRAVSIMLEYRRTRH